VCARYNTPFLEKTQSSESVVVEERTEGAWLGVIGCMPIVVVVIVRIVV
jgi:hypothetical protein